MQCLVERCTTYQNLPPKKRKGRKNFFTRNKLWYMPKEVKESSKRGFHYFNEQSLSCSEYRLSTHCMKDTEVVEVITPVKRRLRCLSLCDGISTGLHILADRLKFDVDAYFSSEIDKNCLRLQQERWFGKMIQLGNMKDIDENLLSSLLPIDLLLAGTPCNELSLVNWRGRGLNDPESSGHLIYKFNTIKNFLQSKMALANRPFFFLLENTAKMRNSVKDAISRELNVLSPVKCCASQFHPMKRERYFWSNLPRIQLNDMSICERKSPSLQKFLRPGRYAHQNISKTITTNISNQATANGKLPVNTVYGTDYFTINEIESLMGLPDHYTDVGNLTPRERQKMIARGWCVPVVQNMLSPISDLYIQLHAIT